MRVSVAEWQFGDDALHFAVGDVVDMYLTVSLVPEPVDGKSDDLGVGRIVGAVRPVHHGWDTFSVIVATIDGADLYCREPAVGSGTVDFLGRIERDHVDPPESLEPSRLWVQRVWVSYDEFVHVGDEHWERSGRPIRYEEVAETTHYLADPRLELEDCPTTGNEATLEPRVHQADHQVREVVAFAPPRALARPVGLKREVCSGAVLDATLGTNARLT